jgi:hypothetical protein
MEHRWGQREATDVAVYFVANSGTAGTGRVLDVSLTGAYLETSVPLRLLSVIYLKLDATALTPGEAQCLAATVVRSDGRGVGLEWLAPQRPKSAFGDPLVPAEAGRQIERTHRP